MRFGVAQALVVGDREMPSEQPLPSKYVSMFWKNVHIYRALLHSTAGRQSALPRCLRYASVVSALEIVLSFTHGLHHSDRVTSGESYRCCNVGCIDLARRGAHVRLLHSRDKHERVKQRTRRKGLVASSSSMVVGTVRCPAARAASTAARRSRSFTLLGSTVIANLKLVSVYSCLGDVWHG